MTPEEFDKWTATVVMGWRKLEERETFTLETVGIFALSGGHVYTASRPQVWDVRWHPSSDLNHMREVEMALDVSHNRALMLALGSATFATPQDGHWFDWVDVFGMVTATCAQRMAAIIAIKPLIEAAECSEKS